MKIVLLSLFSFLTLAANAQKLVFDTFQAGKISLEALFDRSKEALGPKEELKCFIEVTIDEKNKLRLEGRKENGELLFSFGKGNNQMFSADPSDFDDGLYFDIAFFDAAEAQKDPENVDELATFEIYNEVDRIDVYIGAMYGSEDRELLRFTLKDIPDNKQSSKSNRLAINNLKKKLTEILPD